MTGIVAFRAELIDENGDPITDSNPLPTTGGGGGGGGSLADVLLTDDSGTLFVARDDGTTITYFDLNSNTAYTPTGTIIPATLTDAQLRAAPVSVTDAAAESTRQDIMLLLVRMLNYFNAPMGYDKSLQRQRGTVVVETLPTLGNVTTVAGVNNIVAFDGYNARMPVFDTNRVAWAQCVRTRIT